MHRCRELDALTPLDALARWPRTQRVAMLHSARRGRWSILAEPRGHLTAQARSCDWTGVDTPSKELLHACGALEALEAIDAARCGVPCCPFSGWMLAAHYELGRVLEPCFGDVEGTVLHALWCPDALIHDAVEDCWWRIGSPPELEAPATGVEPLLHATGSTRSLPVADDWPERVARCIEYIRAGDIFQVNLTRQLEIDVAGDVRTWACTALAEPQCTFGALLEVPGGPTIVSMSPESFLDITPDGQVTSCPIKGTLPSSQDASLLRDSAKDAAELHMIVDLVRNDLGRVCSIGSVCVDEARCIESYPTVHHGVARVCGMLTPESGLVDVLRATFPAGSITGAPKIRAMQIAAELESCPRGIYCGGIGFLGPGRAMSMSVAIRTATIDPDGTVLRYGTGCGIVAESDPLAELAESQAKARVLHAALGTEVTAGHFMSLSDN